MVNIEPGFDASAEGGREDPVDAVRGDFLEILDCERGFK
jgi:hypothetical protein